jgi:hypothetical protein
MSDRMKRLIETGEVMRQYDIDLGVKQERERVVALIEKAWAEVCSPVMEPDECNLCWLTDNIIKAVKGEN